MMFREKSISKLYAFALAAVFALTLAGCGGGGGTAVMEEEMPMPMPDPQADCMDAGGRYNADGSCTSAEDVAEEGALSDAQDAAAAAAAAAMMAVGGAVDPVAAHNAYGYAKMAADANTAAQAATTSADAMGHQMAAETAQGKAMMAAGMRGLGITKEANAITNQADIDNAILEGQDPDDPDSNATRVGTELAATAAEEAARTTVADSGPGSVSQGAPATSTTVTYGASGPTFKVTGPGTTLQLGESPVGVLTTRGGWKGRELVENAASDTYVMAFTDIQAPTMRQNYGDATTGTEGNEAELGIGHIITGDIPGDGSTFTGTRNVSATDNIPTQMGQFNCPEAASATGCSISVDEDGAIVSVQGYVWRPQTSGTTPATDADYLAWGVWLTVPDGTDDSDVALAGAFASGNDVFTVDADLKGTATYNGVASGLYSAAGMVEYFDADVTLNANFGGTVGADSDPDTDGNDGVLIGAVTGTVSNIKAGGMDIDGMLTLKRAPVIAGAQDGDSTTGFGGDTSGSLAGRAVSGEWGGQFYGPNDASGKGVETEYPTTAAGTFGAAAPGVGSDMVRILGAFGTWKAE